MKEGVSGGFDTIGATHRFFRGLLSEKEQELKVVKENKPGFISYGPVFFVALLKDLLDLVMIGSLPVIGTVITFCCSFTIFVLLLLTRANKKLIDSRFLLRMGIALMLGSMAEGFIFGLNFLPIETITIAAIYFMDKTLSNEQIEKVTQLLSTLHGQYGDALKTARKKHTFQMKAEERAPQEVAQPRERHPEVTKPVLQDVAFKKPLTSSTLLQKKESGMAEPLVLPGVVAPQNTDIKRAAPTFRERMEQGARRVAFPAATAFALGGAPVNAHTVDAPTSPATSAASSQMSKPFSPRRYSTPEELIDRNSPLSISSSKLESTRNVGREELVTLNEMYMKVWGAPNEWVTLSGTDVNGKYAVESHEVGGVGGYQVFQIGDGLQNPILTHTHPVSISETIGISPERIRSGERKAFIMPPSAADVGQCMDDAGNSRLQRIIDPRGMWEYKCDDQHPFVKSKEQLADAMISVVSTLKTSYRISDTEFKDAFTNVSDRHPNLIFPAILEQLEPRYPGIEVRGRELLQETMASQVHIGKMLMEYENKGMKLFQDSMKLSDDELAQRIKVFVAEAEKMGIYIRYIPFKK